MAATGNDEATVVSFGNDDGSLPWAGDWLEINESDGANGGDERLVNVDGSRRLRVQDNDGDGEGVQREVDLSRDPGVLPSRLPS